MASVTLQLDDRTRARLEELSRATERTEAHLVIQALEEFLDANERLTRQIQEATEEADGAPPEEFIDNEKVLGWLRSWGTEEEQEPPL